MTSRRIALFALGFGLFSNACGSTANTPTDATGGSSSSGGSGQAGSASGASSGGASSGGTSSGGASSGGTSSGGTSSGGASSGGTSSGGTSSGGTSSGGASFSGGASSSGGASAGGQSGQLLRGLNLSSAEWGNTVPGVYGTDYTYPTHAEIDAYTGAKMTLFRIPFRWERLQKSLAGELDATELAKLDDIVNYGTSKGARIVIDPHNYARYNDVIIGSGSVTAAHLADLWSRLATHYASNDRVIFGLMNEPHDIAVNTWLEAANASIAAIRKAGATNLIMVPGTNWTGAASWTSSNGAMLGVVDSGNNFVYEVHQYLDSDSSGTHTTCVSATIGTERITGFMNWLASNGKKGFLGEFGAGATAHTREQDQTCATALDSMLSLIESKPELWLGWAYWAGGPWWKPGTSFSIADNTTPWQLTLLESHL